METTHRTVVGDARHLDVPDDAVELVVTSPPYPMIELWDELFAELNPEIQTLLDAGDGAAAFEAMHAALEPVWAELERVVVDGGIVCINVGDATRTVDGSFRVYQNRARILTAMTSLGFEPLPEVVWRKPANSAAKFMGSGMLPPNAYVTLEHEHILVFRNGPQRREFAPGADRRYAAAYFWEERNDWFSDVWTDVRGERQQLHTDGVRDRSGAYPFAIPYRLINMYSVYGDTVLDPFWGTGTTTAAALAAARNSVGYELNDEFLRAFDARVDDLPALSRTVAKSRLDTHREFVAHEEAAGESFDYTAEHYDFPVRTKQERSIRLYEIAEISPTAAGYEATHEPVDGRDTESAGDSPAGGTKHDDLEGVSQPRRDT